MANGEGLRNESPQRMTEEDRLPNAERIDNPLDAAIDLLDGRGAGRNAQRDDLAVGFESRIDREHRLGRAASAADDDDGAIALAAKDVLPPVLPQLQDARGVRLPKDAQSLRH